MLSASLNKTFLSLSSQRQREVNVGDNLAVGQIGRKEMFYLTTHSTLYLRLYGVRHMVKDHSNSERGNPLLPHRLLFPISSKGSFICIIPHTTAFVTPVVEH